MRIVVTGCNGQLALSLVERAKARTNIEVITVGRPQLDLTRPETVLAALAPCRPNIVVSAAAYTAVDQAEEEKETAFAVNAVGAGAVAEAAARLGVPVIHVSTDYVFDGSKEGSYTEADPPAPLSVYGASKLAGERAVAAACPCHLILRIGWVFSPFGKNFVKTILKLAEDHGQISVVADQRGNPSSGLDVADALINASLSLTRSRQSSCFGVYHLAGTGDASRADLARHVVSVSLAHGGPWAPVRNLATAEFPARALRPANSCLSVAKFAAMFGWTMPAWQHSVETVVKRLVLKKQQSEQALPRPLP